MNENGVKNERQAKYKNKIPETDKEREKKKANALKILHNEFRNKAMKTFQPILQQLFDKLQALVKQEESQEPEKKDVIKLDFKEISGGEENFAYNFLTQEHTYEFWKKIENIKNIKNLQMNKVKNAIIFNASIADEETQQHCFYIDYAGKISYTKNKTFINSLLNEKDVDSAKSTSEQQEEKIFAEAETIVNNYYAKQRCYAKQEVDKTKNMVTSKNNCCGSSLSTCCGGCFENCC